MYKYNADVIHLGIWFITRNYRKHAYNKKSAAERRYTDFLEETPKLRRLCPGRVSCLVVESSVSCSLGKSLEGR